MGTVAAIIGAVGGLCAVLGIVTLTKVMPPLGTQYDWSFWSTLSIILLLGAIAIGVGRLGGRD